MSTGEWSTGAGKSTQGFGGASVLCVGQVAFAYAGYTTDKEGQIVIKSYFDSYRYRQDGAGAIWKLGKVMDAEPGTPNAYQDEQGKWKVKGADEPLQPEQYHRAYNDHIYLQFKVISPVQWYGAEAVARCRVAGIEFPEGVDHSNLWLVTSGNTISALLKFSMSLGLKASGFDSASPAYDPAYALPYLKTLEFPLTPVQVFLKVFHPLLIKHANEGKLATAEVKPRKKETDQSNFLDQATVKAIDTDDAQRIWAEVTAAEAANQPPEPIPFPGEEATAPPPAPVAPVRTPTPTAQPAPTTPPTQPANRDALETEVRSLIAAGKATGEQVLDWIEEMGKLPPDPNQSALAAQDAASLQVILAKIKGPAGPRL